MFAEFRGARAGSARFKYAPVRGPYLTLYCLIMWIIKFLNKYNYK